MSLTKDCAPHVANIVFGFAGLAFGGIVSEAAGTAASVISLAAVVRNELKKAKPESKKQIERLITHIADETRARIDERGWGKYELGSLVTKAQKRLSVYLPDLDVEHGQLGRDAFEEGGFPKAATRRIVAAIVAAEAADETVAEDAKLFQGAADTQVALDFVNDVFDHAFGLALVDRNYFESLEPHLVVGIAEGVGDLKRGQARIEAALKALLEGQARDSRAIANAVARQGEVELPEALLAALAERTDASLSLEDQVSDLISRFDAAQEIIREGSAPSNLDAFVKAVQKRVADKTLAGDLDGADAEAEGAFAQWKRDEAERAEAAQHNGAALIDTAIETALARGDADAVALREMRKIALTVPEAGRFGAARAIQQVYFKRGQTHGARIDLSIAAALARIYGQTSDKGRRATAKNDLGTILFVLGERGDEEALLKAVEAFNDVLKVHTRNSSPGDWAHAQNNLGISLRFLAERFRHHDKIDDAIKASKSALEVYHPKVNLESWAGAQNNLGYAFMIASELGHKDALKQAIGVFYQTLEYPIRDIDAWAWAALQDNLGNALMLLARTGETWAFKKSLFAFKASLEVRTCKVAPMQWAQTQGNIAQMCEWMADSGEDIEANLIKGIAANSKALNFYRSIDKTSYIQQAELLQARLRERLAMLKS
ncbi:MAG: hypothetical protein AAGI14_00740 [Pseudomonadota bacterium]